MISSQTAKRILILAPVNLISERRWQFINQNKSVSVQTIESSDLNVWRQEIFSQLSSLNGHSYGASIVLMPSTQATIPELIVSLIKSGADDVVSLADPEADELLNQTIESLCRLLADAQLLETQFGLVGKSLAMQLTRKMIAIAARNSQINVLILGETGTGKCLAARAIHSMDSSRKNQPFHAIDCGAVTDSLFGSEIFGHVSGAFTGAISSRGGAFAAAKEGSLLLDEIGELSPSLQSSFLSALQERQYKPIGSDTSRPIKCRVLAATNRDLEIMVDKGQFRTDLFYRLDGIRVEIPPLRNHPEDIPQLFEHFCHLYANNLDEHPLRIDPDIFDMLADNKLTGNIRQLENIARVSVLNSGNNRVRVPHLPLGLLNNNLATSHSSTESHYLASMIEKGLSWENIQEQLRQQAAYYSLKLAKDKHPSSPRAQQVKLAANQLKISTRSIYDWAK